MGEIFHNANGGHNLFSVLLFVSAPFNQICAAYFRVAASTFSEADDLLPGYL
jgi:hypothetical protein